MTRSATVYNLLVSRPGDILAEDLQTRHRALPWLSAHRAVTAAQSVMAGRPGD